MIWIDRINLRGKGWSHVLSDTDSVEELEAFRKRVGAPPSALQLPPRASIPHLDIKLGPRERAFRIAEREPDACILFPTTRELLRHRKEHRRRRGELS